jgi:hypothetical protein
MRPPPPASIGIAVLASLAACGGGAGGGADAGAADADVPPLAMLAVGWRPVTPARDGTTLVEAPCRADATAFVLLRREGSSESIQIGQPCDDGGLTTTLAAGTYDVAVRLATGEPAERYAESAPETIALAEDALGEIDVDVLDGFGAYRLGWAITDGDDALGCAGVAGASAVSITATAEGGGALLDTTVDCADGDGALALTRPLPAGPPGEPAYALALALLDGEDEVLGTADAYVAPPLTYGGELVELADPIEIVVPAAIAP